MARVVESERCRSHLAALLGVVLAPLAALRRLIGQAFRGLCAGSDAAPRETQGRNHGKSQRSTP
jgi:hypothetical protein